MDLGILISAANTAALIIGISAAVFFMMRYLQRGESPSKSRELERIKNELTELRNIKVHSSNEAKVSLLEMKEDIAHLKENQSVLNSDERQSIIEKLKAQLNEQAAQEVLDKIQETLSETNIEIERTNIVETQFENTIERLKKELFALSKRGNLNLSIGIVTTITGLVLLGMFVISDRPPVDEAGKFIANFIPRISLVILIEIFAYFFLKLYKSNLSEIKYFQNEITSVESKYLALKVAINAGDSVNIQNVIDHLSKTERNFILEKGQSTVDLERTKIDQQATTDILSKISEFISKKS